MKRFPMLRRSVVAAIGVSGAVVGAPWAMPSPTASATAGYQEYVALGDSSVAAAGLLPPPTTEFVPVGCAQMSYNHPHRIAAALGVPRFFDASCSGATTANMTAPQEILGGVNAPQLDHLTPTTDLVTITIGTNDIDMGGAVLGCFSLLPVNTDNRCRTGIDQAVARLPQVEQSVVQVLNEIRHRSPNAQIFVVNYITSWETGCWPIIPITNADVLRLRDASAQTNAMLARAASATGAYVADIASASVGHGNCTGPTVRWVEGFIPVSLNGVQVLVPFHVNSAGCAAQASVVLGAIRAVPPVTTTTTTTSTTSTTTTSSSTSTSTTSISSSTPDPTVTTAIPTTAAPATATPTTEAPTASPPDTEPPDAEPPDTEPPDTEPPLTVAPTTVAPTTVAPPTLDTTTTTTTN